LNLLGSAFGHGGLRAAHLQPRGEATWLHWHVDWCEGDLSAGIDRANSTEFNRSSGDLASAHVLSRGQPKK
jgi:hypothetical protein